mmetsp:Transcript_11875/g.18338  ORF Transcript_11875/g.18338 Transcript_11875/m.18338 type:complete len:92 (-) Transcript_11875:109-384(-)
MPQEQKSTQIIMSNHRSVNFTLRSIRNSRLRKFESSEEWVVEETRPEFRKDSIILSELRSVYSKSPGFSSISPSSKAEKLDVMLILGGCAP